MVSSLYALLGLTATTLACPLPQAATITAQDLVKIAPGTASCVGATYPEECAIADVAAPNIAQSFRDYSISSFGAQAALVALMLYESGDFKYSKHHFPSPNPGQGTRNMQSAHFNTEYATYLTTHPLCGNNTAVISSSRLFAAQAQSPDDLLALVNTDRLGFGSAAWFLSTQCDEAIQSGLASGTEVAFSSYISSCVGTTATPDRIAIWEAVMALKSW